MADNQTTGNTWIHFARNLNSLFLKISQKIFVGFVGSLAFQSTRFS